MRLGGAGKQKALRSPLLPRLLARPAAEKHSIHQFKIEELSDPTILAYARAKW
jgi:hypothetical protein